MTQEIKKNEVYKDPETGQEWAFKEGRWQRASHPFVQRLRQRGGVVVLIDGQRHDVRLSAFRDPNQPDTETIGLPLSDIDLLLKADGEA